MAIYRGSGGTGTGSESDFAELVQQAQDAAAAAQLAETNAELAEVNAELAETNAELAATNAATSETNAANSASSASTSATNAAASATSASNSASTATTQATNASNSAAAAATSASNAASSATNAADSATTAQTAQTAAELAENNAETAATAAALSATNAANSATSASTSATNASSSASAAATSATNADNSALAAATSETNAANSATSASTSAATATTQASNAATSASAAATSASNAATSETNAASSALSASTSATNAANSASAALISETNAASSASAAATSASNAANSATSASASASAAAASYDDFDDRYLGSKSSAPTLDNDGNTLQVGALYFSTSSNSMKVWNGTTWLDAYASLSGALLASNNLSDVSNVTTSRTNLGAAASGANTDITSLTGITGAISTVDSIQFDTTAGVSVGQAQMAWNADERTFDFGLNGVTLQVGQEQVVNVRNNTASTIPNGTVCMATGTLGASGRITVSPMDGTSAANARYIIGIATEDILAGEDGFVTTFGKIRNLNTSAWNDGDVLYTSTITAGALTNVAPTSGLKQPIAFVIHAASNGTLFVRINPYDENSKAVDADKLDGNDSTYFQQALVSGTNIKTINGSSILGSGDITVGVTALFPFYNSSGVLDTIGLLSGQYLPFFDNTGSAKNIQLTT